MSLDKSKIMNKSLVFFILVVIMSQVTVAVSLNDYDSLEVNTKISVPIKFIKTGGRTSLDYLTINYSWLPIEDYRQETVYVKTNPPSEITKDYAFLEVNTPDNFIYELEFRTKSTANHVKVNKKVEFPLTKLDEELIYFTKETEMIDINEDIRTLASKIAGDEDDLYVVVFKLADWVNTNIEYNLSTVTSSASLPSSWVLENKRGVCDEMSNLFVSMVRSLGIPARTVTGVAYTDSDLFDEPWGAHGWTEVYFPEYGWIPFDPTYNQLGYVDASHIKLDEGLNSERFNAKYFWKGLGYDVEPGKQILSSTVINKGNVVKEDLDISLEFFSNSVDFNSYNVIKAKIKNLNDYYYAKPITLAGMQGTTNMDEPIKDVLLKPGETAEVSWIVKLNGDFKNNYYYEFPIMVYTPGDLSFTKTFTAEENAKHVTLETAKEFANVKSEKPDSGISFSCDIDEDVVFIEELFNISCNIESEKKQNYLVCINQEDCFVVAPKDYNNIFIEKSFSEAGFKTFSVTAKKLPYNEHTFLSINVIDAAKLEIDGLKTTKSVTYSDIANIDFSLKKISKSTPVDITVKIEHDYFDQVWVLDKIPFEQPFSFNVPVSNLKNGENEFLITVQYYDEKGNVYNLEQKVFIDVNESNVVNQVLLWFNEASDWINDLFQ